jgi:hypothetical protein
MAFNRSDLDGMDQLALVSLRDYINEKIKGSKEAQKAEAKKLTEAEKENVEKEVKAAIAAKVIKEGTVVVLKFKGAENAFAVKGLSEKTFRISTDAGDRFVKFNQFVRLA